MLFCDKTITLVKCDGEAYEATAICGVSWMEQTAVKPEGTGMASANMVKIRIPVSALRQGAAFPSVGDHVVLGMIPSGALLERPADLAVYHPKKVMAVADNRRGGLPHVRLDCQ